MLRIAAYCQLRRAQIAPTGVGKHIIHMVNGLAQMPGAKVTVVGSSHDMASPSALRADSPLAGLPAVGLPLSTLWMERVWRVAHWPSIEHWLSEKVDWIYCPAECFVPTRKAKLAVTVHDMHAMETNLPWSNSPEHRRFRSKWASLMKPIVRHADLILTVSEFSKQRVVEFTGVNPSRIAVVGNGVENAYFQASNASVQPAPLGGQPYIIMVGGLTKRKGGDWTLGVARELAKIKSPIQIAVAGRGDADYEAQARELSNMHLLGYVDVAELTHWVRQSLALLFLSRYEGFGIPAIEAMAVGTAVVVSSCASLPEVVGDAGLVVDADASDAVAATLTQLLNDAPYRLSLIAKGKARAADFQWSRCVERLVGALQTH